MSKRVHVRVQCRSDLIVLSNCHTHTHTHTHTVARVTLKSSCQHFKLKIAGLRQTMQSPKCASLAGFSEFRVFISEDRSVPKFPVSLSERVSASEFSDLVREYVAPVSECGSNFEI